MNFNRSKFLDETGGSIDALFDCIDLLTEVLDRYIEDDVDAGGNGYGCYNKPEGAVKEHIGKSAIAEYLDY